jgi:hypothetical protein
MVYWWNLNKKKECINLYLKYMIQIILNNFSLYGIIMIDSLYTSIFYLIHQIFNIHIKPYHLSWSNRIQLYTFLHLISLVVSVLTWGNINFLFLVTGMFVEPLIQNLFIEFNYHNYIIFSKLRYDIIKTQLLTIGITIIKTIIKDILLIDEEICIDTNIILEHLNKKDIYDTLYKFIKNATVITIMRYLRSGFMKLSYRLTKYSYYMGTGKLVTNMNSEEAENYLRDLVLKKEWNLLLKPDTTQAILIILENQPSNPDYLNQLLNNIFNIMIRINTLFFCNYIFLFNISPYFYCLLIICNQIFSNSYMSMSLGISMNIINIMIDSIHYDSLMSVIISEIIYLLSVNNIYDFILTKMNKLKITLNKLELFESTKLFIFIIIIKLSIESYFKRILVIIGCMLMFNPSSYFSMIIIVLNMLSNFNIYHYITLNIITNIYSCSFEFDIKHDDSILKENIKIDAFYIDNKLSNSSKEIMSESNKSTGITNESNKSTEIIIESNKSTEITNESNKSTEIIIDNNKSTEIMSDNKSESDKMSENSKLRRNAVRAVLDTNPHVISSMKYNYQPKIVHSTSGAKKFISLLKNIF